MPSSNSSSAVSGDEPPISSCPLNSKSKSSSTSSSSQRRRQHESLRSMPHDPYPIRIRIRINRQFRIRVRSGTYYFGSGFGSLWIRPGSDPSTGLHLTFFSYWFLFEELRKQVRDRATLYLSTLGEEGIIGETENDANEFLFGSLDIPLINLQTSLQNYDASEEPFDISSVPKEVKSQPLVEKKAPGRKPTGLGAPSAAPTSVVDAYEKLLSSIPEFSIFGKLFKSSAPVELTEAETEYSVNVVKHIYDQHVVLQYNCTNTIPEQLLENVIVFVDASEAEDFLEVATKPLGSLPYDSPGQTFVAFQKPAGVPSVGKFSNLLKFIVKEVDPSTGEAEEEGVEDEYQLEELEITAADYMLKVGVSNFRNAWESMDPVYELVDEYGLGARESLVDAVNAVITILGMQPCEGTEVVPSNSRSHTCLLSGVFIGNVKVLARLSFGIDSTKQVAMKLAVRSEDQDVSGAIHEIVTSG